MRGASRRLRVGVAALALLFCARSALGARVAIFQSASGLDATEAELVRRLDAELRSGGFEVVVLEAAGERDQRALEERAVRSGSFAAVRHRDSSGAVIVEIWVAPARGAPGGWKRLESGGPDAASALALRTTELLRARFIEVGGETPPEPEPAPRDARDPELRGLEPRPTFSASLGPSLFASPGGFGATLAPAAGIGYRPFGGVWLELRVASPASSDVSSAAGSASVDESLLALGVRGELFRFGSLGAFVAGAAGAYRIATEGDAIPPNQSRSDGALTSAWLAGAGVTLEAALTKSFRIATVLRGDAALLAPAPVVRLAGEAQARPGRPLVLGTLALEARW